MSSQSQTRMEVTQQVSSVSAQTGLLRHTNTSQATLQRVAISAAPAHSVPPIVHDVLRSPGQSLDSGTRSFMESRFGHDFSGVRIHTDGQAAASARAVNALAYTVGRDVVFGSGQYLPGTMAGKRLLAHELTHVVQQGRGGSSLTSLPESRLEEDAHQTSRGLVQDRGPVQVTESSQVRLSRETNDERIERQKQNNFVNLPEGVQSIISPPKQADTSQPQNAVEKDKQAPATRRFPVDAQAWEDVELYPIVEDQLPSHDTFSPSSGTISSGIYRIHPLVRNHDDPHVVYYAAYNTRAQRTEYAIGPAYLDFFLSHITLYMIAAGNFFGFSGPRPYELATGKVISRGIRGDLRGAVRALGTSWLQALQDPNWWIQALGATAGMAAPEAEVASAEGKVPPTSEVAPVEGKVPPTTEAAPVEGTAGAKELEGSGPIPRSVGAASRAEMLAKKLGLNIESPTTRQLLNNLDMSTKDFIGKFRKGSILSEFPGEFLKEGVTVEDALVNGGSKVRKLLIDGRFAK